MRGPRLELASNNKGGGGPNDRRDQAMNAWTAAGQLYRPQMPQIAKHAFENGPEDDADGLGTCRCHPRHLFPSALSVATRRRYSSRGVPKLSRSARWSPLALR